MIEVRMFNTNSDVCVCVFKPLLLLFLLSRQKIQIIRDNPSITFKSAMLHEYSWSIITIAKVECSHIYIVIFNYTHCWSPFFLCPLHSIHILLYFTFCVATDFSLSFYPRSFYFAFKSINFYWYWNIFTHTHALI